MIRPAFPIAISLALFAFACDNGGGDDNGGSGGEYIPGEDDTADDDGGGPDACDSYGGTMTVNGTVAWDASPDGSVEADSVEYDNQSYCVSCSYYDDGTVGIQYGVSGTGPPGEDPEVEPFRFYVTIYGSSVETGTDYLDDDFYAELAYQDGMGFNDIAPEAEMFTETYIESKSVTFTEAGMGAGERVVGEAVFYFSTPAEDTVEISFDCELEIQETGRR